MGKYSFLLGSASFQTCTVDTDGKCKIRKIRVNSSDGGGDTSLEIGVSSRSESDLSLTYQIEDQTRMFEEIIKIIMENELRNYVSPTPIDEQALMDEIMRDLEYNKQFIDEDDSNDLHGFSDIVSINSAETIDIGYIREQFEDIKYNIDAEYKYLSQAI